MRNPAVVKSLGSRYGIKSPLTKSGFTQELKSQHTRTLKKSGAYEPRNPVR